MRIVSDASSIILNGGTDTPIMESTLCNGTYNVWLQPNAKLFALCALLGHEIQALLTSCVPVSPKTDLLMA